MKVIIAGGRDFTDYDFLADCANVVLDSYPLDDGDSFQFVSGNARGADKLGEEFALSYHRFLSTVFKPDYENDPPRLAPLRRNRHMAEYAMGGILIAFLKNDVEYGERGGGTWAIKGGTSNMIMNALSHGMDVHIFRYGPEG